MEAANKILTQDIIPKIRNKCAEDNESTVSFVNCPEVTALPYCDTDNFGLVIGKGGSMLNHIQQTYNVKIAVPSKDDTNRFPSILILNDPIYPGDPNGAAKFIKKLLDKKSTN